MGKLRFAPGVLSDIFVELSCSVSSDVRAPIVLEASSSEDSTSKKRDPGKLLCDVAEVDFTVCCIWLELIVMFIFQSKMVCMDQVAHLLTTPVSM